MIPHLLKSRCPIRVMPAEVATMPAKAMPGRAMPARAAKMLAAEIKPSQVETLLGEVPARLLSISSQVLARLLSKGVVASRLTAMMMVIQQ